MSDISTANERARSANIAADIAAIGERPDGKVLGWVEPRPCFYRNTDLNPCGYCLGCRERIARETFSAPDRDELASYEKFDGIGPHAETIETRARIGERYLEAYESALSDPRLKGYTPADCPSELLLDLINGDALTPATAPDPDLMQALRSALRFAASRSAITSAQESAILSLMGEG